MAWQVLWEAIFLHVAIMFDCTDAQRTANCMLMDQLLQQFPFEAVHSSCYESMAFNDWWEGLCLLGYYCQWYFFYHPSR